MTYSNSPKNSRQYLLFLTLIAICSITQGFVPLSRTLLFSKERSFKEHSKEVSAVYLVPKDRSAVFNPFGTSTSPILTGMKSAAKIESKENTLSTRISEGKLSEKTKLMETIKTDKYAITDEDNKTEKKTPSIVWRGVVLGICLVWSTNFAVIKEIFQAAPTIDPSLYAAIRFSLASLVMLPRTFNSIGNILCMRCVPDSISDCHSYYETAI